MPNVWDRWVRVLHWTLVISIAVSWLIAERWLEWHEVVGYVALAVVVVRIGWGFIGSRYARFSQFVRSPASTLRYSRHLLSGDEPRYVGHNPLGAWMVVLMLSCVLALAATGWLYTTDRFWGEAWLEQLHGGLAWTLLALVCVHVAGVVFTSLKHRENLVRAMLDGRKRAPSQDDIA